MMIVAVLFRPAVSRSRAAGGVPDEFRTVLGIGTSFAFGRDSAVEGETRVAAPPSVEPQWVDNDPGRKKANRKPNEIPSGREA